MSLPATFKRGEPIKGDYMYMQPHIYICARHAHAKRNKLVCVKVNCRWSWRSEITDLAAMPDCGICPIRSKHNASIEKRTTQIIFPNQKNVPYVELCGIGGGIQGEHNRNNQHPGSMLKVSATLPGSGINLAVWQCWHARRRMQNS